MMRNLALMTLALGLGIGLALCPDMADAVPRGGFPSGARLYGLAPVLHHPGKAETPKALPKLAEPLDYLDAIIVTPSRLLEYPFLNPPRCPVQSAASNPCETPASAIDDALAGQSSVVR
jgi:hypothetical protein